MREDFVCLCVIYFLHREFWTWSLMHRKQVLQYLTIPQTLLLSYRYCNHSSGSKNAPPIFLSLLDDPLNLIGSVSINLSSQLLSGTCATFQWLCYLLAQKILTASSPLRWGRHFWVPPPFLKKYSPVHCVAYLVLCD